MFRDDFEFNDTAGPSHLGQAGGGRPAHSPEPELAADSLGFAPAEPAADTRVAAGLSWTPEAEKELIKIPFFVRGKARRNTEVYARQSGVSRIEIETIYDARSHFAR